jgi:hypothetical protein
MNRAKTPAATLIFLTIVAIGWFVWPTEWSYSEVDRGEKSRGGGEVTLSLKTRTNRMTGHRQVFTDIEGVGKWTDWVSGE